MFSQTNNSKLGLMHHGLAACRNDRAPPIHRPYTACTPLIYRPCSARAPPVLRSAIALPQILDSNPFQIPRPCRRACPASTSPLPFQSAPGSTKIISEHEIVWPRLSPLAFPLHHQHVSFEARSPMGSGARRIGLRAMNDKIGLGDLSRGRGRRSPASATRPSGKPAGQTRAQADVGATP